MKRVLIVISLLFLCGTYSAARNRGLTQQEFKRFVDYANTQLILEFTYNSRGDDGEIRSNLLPVRESLQTVNLNNVPDFTYIRNLVRNAPQTLRLAYSVNRIKQSWQYSLSVDELINLINVDSHYGVNLAPASEQVREEIRAYLSQQPLLAIISVILTLLTLIILFLVFRKKLTKWIVTQIFQPQEEVSELNKKIASLETEINDLKEKQSVDINDDVINAIVDKVIERLKLDEREENEAPQPTPSTGNVKYPTVIGSGSSAGFRGDLSDTQGDRYFRFINIKGNTAEFEFCGTIDKARSIKDTLKDVCEISGIVDHAKDVINKEPGIVTLRNGRWEINSPAKIRFE